MLRVVTIRVNLELGKITAQPEPFVSAILKREPKVIFNPSLAYYYGHPYTHRVKHENAPGSLTETSLGSEYWRFCLFVNYLHKGANPNTTVDDAVISEEISTKTEYAHDFFDLLEML